MSDDETALAEFKGTTRLFPLPNLVLFPHVMQGLHIFEPRYRQMMADTLADDQLMTLVLLRPGYEEDSDEPPAIEPVGCLGRVDWHEMLPDGRFNLRLRGLGRVKLVEEIPTDRLYRVARAEPLPDVSPMDLPKLTSLRRTLSEAVLARFPQTGQAHNQLLELFQGEMPLGHLCDVLSYALPLSMEVKQTLLNEPHVDLRAELMTQAMQVPAGMANRKFPPEFSVN
jgi:Lon protease-like protein